ncbi:hypothetical protein [Scytonema sp. PCC 10023]|uniref:hypothetical protein n=1 Tax=Scytonema sp. PCC 10023 TaxID=1680591 RepID=UPI0039C6CBD8
MDVLASTKTFLRNLLPLPLVKKVQSFLFIIATHRLRGFDIHLNYPERRILEDIIIPYFVKHKEFHKILFIGCDWYTKPYKNTLKIKIIGQ